ARREGDGRRRVRQVAGPGRRHQRPDRAGPRRVPAPGTTVESLSALKPSFAAVADMGGFGAVALQKYHWVEKINHVHTPGNSSGIVDGASLLAIGNEQIGDELGMKPKARILATAVGGADPTIMLTGPAPASKKALAKAGITV